MALCPISAVQPIELLLLPGAGPPGRRGGVLEGRIAIVGFAGPAFMMYQILKIVKIME